MKTLLCVASLTAASVASANLGGGFSSSVTYRYGPPVETHSAVWDSPGPEFTAAYGYSFNDSQENIAHVSYNADFDYGHASIEASGDGFGRAIGDMTCTAAITDTITVSSSTLAPGTAVTLTLIPTLWNVALPPNDGLHDSTADGHFVYTTGWDGGLVKLAYQISGSGFARNRLDGFSFRHNDNVIPDEEYALAGPGELSPYQFSTTIGSTFNLSWSLTANAGGGAFASSGDYSLSNYGSLSSRAFGTVQILGGSDVSVVGANGYNYANLTTPVPEPASLAALGFGALALLRRRSRRA